MWTSRANLKPSLLAPPPLPQVCAHQGPADHVGRTWCLMALPGLLFSFHAVCLGVLLCLAIPRTINASLTLLDHLFCIQCITHLAGSPALRPVHHSPHFTICSVAYIPPPPVLWTATHCSLIPGDTVPIILFSFDLTAFTAAACYHTYGLPPLLQHHTSFIPASYQPHTSLMPLCFTSCATNFHDHELHKCSSVKEVAQFLFLLVLITFV